MPSAGEVASQRETERSCERELRLLRAQRGPAEGGRGDGPVAPARSDSSGSEGEAALAAAVTALRVAPRPETPRAACGAASFLAALPPLLPSAAAGPALALRRALPADARAARASLRRVVRGATAALAGADGRATWPDADVVGAGCALCAAVLAGAPGARAALRRLLDERAAPSAADELARLAADAAPEPRARLRLADAARGGPPGGGAAPFAAHLDRRTLRELLRPAAAPADEAPGRLLALGAAAPLSAAALAAAVAVAGRALAALPRPRERERLLGGLAALARAPAAPGDERPSRLKVPPARRGGPALPPAAPDRAPLRRWRSRRVRCSCCSARRRDASSGSVFPVNASFQNCLSIYFFLRRLSAFTRSPPRGNELRRILVSIRSVAVSIRK